MYKSSWINLGPANRRSSWPTGLNIFSFSENFEAIRLIGSPRFAARHFFEPGDGSNSYYVPCFGYRSKTQEFFESETCPACRIGLEPKVFLSCNAIIRSIQKDKPSKLELETPSEKGFRDKNDPSWTPVRVIEIPATSIASIGEIEKQNTHRLKGVEVTKGVEDTKYGRDLMVALVRNPKFTKYEIKSGKVSPLSDEELLFLKFDLSTIPNLGNSQKPESLHYEAKNRLAALLKANKLAGRK